MIKMHLLIFISIYIDNASEFMSIYISIYNNWFNNGIKLP